MNKPKIDDSPLIKTLLSFHEKYKKGGVPLKHLRHANYLHDLAIFFKKHKWLSDLQLNIAQNRLKKISQSLPIDLNLEIKIDEKKKEGKKARLVNDKIILSFWDHDREGFFKLLKKVKSLPRKRFDPKSKDWIVPLGAEALLYLKRWDFEMDENLTNKYKMLVPDIKKGEKIDIPNSSINLYPYQKEGVLFIEKTQGRTLLTDQMGTGKTYQSITWAAIHPEKRPVIVIVPASLKINWQREIFKILPDEKSIIINGRSPQKIEIDNKFIIINYDILENHLEELKKLNAKIAIIDECQAIRNSDSLRTIATKEIVKDIPHIIALSGTPIENRPKEFFNILNLLKPELWPNFWDYAKKYCNAKYNGFGWDFTGKKNTKELNEILRKTVMIRRLKEEVLKDLPPKIRTIIPIEIENRKEYEEIVEELGPHKGLLENIERLRQVIIRGKMKGVIKWIETFLESDEKLIIFASHHWTIDYLVDHFKKKKVGLVKLDGRDSPTKKQRAVDDFQLKENIKLFIANTIAGGIGLNLTAASNIAIIELEWTSTKEDQAEDRAHRIGQVKTVNIWYLLAADTLEEDMAEILDEKRKTLSEILDGKNVKSEELLTMLLRKIKERRNK